MILDIGGNIGYTAVVFAKHVSPEYKVHVFEPDPENYKVLSKTVAPPSIRQKIITNCLAVGDKDGEISLWLNQDHHADHRIVTDHFQEKLSKEAQIIRVKVVSIDNYLREKFPAKAPKVSFIKIDVQGYEPNVCEGMKETLAQNPQAIIAFEHSPEISDELGFPSDLVPCFFVRLGYDLHLLNFDGSTTLVSIAELDDLSKKRGYADLLAIKSKI